MSEKIKGAQSQENQLLAEQFKQSADVQWGTGWEEKINTEIVSAFLNEFQRRSLCPHDLIPDISKAIRFDDYDYYAAIQAFILEKPTDVFEELREVIENAEEIARPNLAEVFSYLTEILSSESIEIPDSSKIPAMSQIEREVLYSSEEGDLAQLLLDMCNAFKRAAHTGRVNAFFEETPDFWSHYFISKERLG